MEITLSIWLFTVGVAAHNCEEAFLVRKLAAGNAPLPSGIRPGSFAFATQAMTLLLVMFAIGAISVGKNSIWAYLFTGYAFTMLGNILFPHVLATVALRRYAPGTATAIIFNLPLGLLFLHQAHREKFVAWNVVAWSAPLITVALIVLLPILLALGDKLAGRFE